MELEQTIYNVDDKGRPLAEFMTDGEKLTEILLNLRGLADALQDLGSSPMIAALMPKGLKLF